MDMTRRSTLIGAASSVFALNSARSQLATPLPRGSKVVVVGAGFAGIGVSEHLLEAGYQVELIEANDRIGGRAHSIDLGGFPADIGANWLRLEDNSLWDFAERRGLLSQQTDFEDVIVVKDGQKHKVDTQQTTDSLEGALVWPYLSYTAQRWIGLRPRSRSIESLLGNTLKEMGPEACAARVLFEANYAADLDKLSAGVLFEDSSGGAEGPATEPTVVGGMINLLNQLAAKSKPNLNERVEVVRRTSSGVNVKTDKREIEADAVILTVSIDVLKKGGIVIEPELPSAHRTALEGMEMGNFLKLWLRYPEGAWSADSNLTVFCESPLVSACFDFSRSHNAPVILGIAAGRRAHEIEKLEDGQAGEEFHQLLQSKLNVTLPPPIEVAMSRWGQDPLHGGAYMYPSTQYRPGDNLMLHAPIAERIFLAGEALSDVSGYVDTAWSDGVRAADLIIGS